MDNYTIEDRKIISELYVGITGDRIAFFTADLNLIIKILGCS